MATVTVRNLPDDVHRAVRLRAAQNGRSTEAEIRFILEAAVKSPERVRLGTVMAAASRRLGLTNEDVAALQASIDRSPAEPMSFE